MRGSARSKLSPPNRRRLLINATSVRFLVHTCRTVQGCLAVRRDNVATRPSFFGLEIMMDLPDEIYYHPTVVELTGYITDMVIDIVSYNREQATGDENHNLITAIMQALALDRGGAMAWAAHYHSQMQTKFIMGLSTLPSWGPSVDPQLREYLNGMATWATANYCWSYESQRYFGNKGPQILESRLVPLLEKVELDPALHRENVIVADILI
ncbi:hypothetical protein HYDPIDRAFT_86563 [Hydnomerulius pinastri MD-312]|nr:hypothetical protein HYDPIDRAFT_86563 [Hydnomerulius pinastri MD-312]